MITLTAREPSVPRLIFISAGLLLYAGSAFTAAPAFDLQEQLRQLIVPSPNSGSVIGTNANTPAIPAAGIGRVDLQEQVRQFIAPTPNFELGIDWKAQRTANVYALGNARVDLQEQVREVILVGVNLADLADRAAAPGLKPTVTLAVSVRRNPDVHSGNR